MKLEFKRNEIGWHVSRGKYGDHLIKFNKDKDRWEYEFIGTPTIELLVQGGVSYTLEGAQEIAQQWEDTVNKGLAEIKEFFAIEDYLG